MVDCFRPYENLDAFLCYLFEISFPNKFTWKLTENNFCNKINYFYEVTMEFEELERNEDLERAAFEKDLEGQYFRLKLIPFNFCFTVIVLQPKSLLNIREVAFRTFLQKEN